MYEIWLAANVFFELARMHWQLLAGLVVLWVLLVTARLIVRGSGAIRMRGTLVLVWIVATVVAALVLPSLTRSALANVAYVVDWINLLAMAGGIGAVITAFAWPLIGLARSGRVA
jgi:hypothetical protein